MSIHKDALKTNRREIMRKIYTVVFALMVLLSVTMSAMATTTDTQIVVNAPSAPAPAPAGNAPSVVPDDARVQNAQADAFA